MPDVTNEEEYKAFIKDIITGACRRFDDALSREMVQAALDELHTAQQRIAALEAQLKSAREEIRRYVAAKMGGCDG